MLILPCPVINIIARCVFRYRSAMLRYTGLNLGDISSQVGNVNRYNEAWPGHYDISLMNRVDDLSYRVCRLAADRASLTDGLSVFLTGN